jgi:hypothetical protein
MGKSIFDQISDRTKRFEERGGFGTPTNKLQDMSMRDMLALTRPKLNEDVARTISQSEIDREHEKMQNYFADDNVEIEFKDFMVKPDAVFMSGIIDGQILFAYTVASQETQDNKGVQIEYLNGFDATNPDNDQIIKKVQAYYNDFYKYWRDNELQLTGN